MTDPMNAARRLVRNLTKPPAGTPVSPLVMATVSAVVNGGAQGGAALVTVDYLGGSYTAQYLSSYTPIVGHVVRCLYDGATLNILGRIIGTPPEV